MSITEKVQDAVKGAKEGLKGRLAPDVGIISLLKNEHKEVASLMDEISNTEDDEIGEEQRASIFEELYAKLLPHAKGEEEALYPRLLEVEGIKDLANEAVQEHRVVSLLLNELKSMATHGDTWIAKFTVLQENVEHHVEEEENEMFVKMRGALSADELVQLGKTYGAARDRHAAALSKAGKTGQGNSK